MKAIKIILIILAILIGLFLIIAAFLPNKLYIETSRVIDKPASLLFKQVNNLHNWPAWSPWQEYDTAQVNTYEGPVLGVGAKTSWESAKNGNGSMTIMESIPYSLVTYELDFGQQGRATSAFKFEEAPEGTKVVWSLDIPSLGYPLGRWFGVMMPGMMKTYSEKGLANLEKVTKDLPDPPVIEFSELPEMNVLAVLDSCGWDEISVKMEQSYTELMTAISRNKKTSVAGYPYAEYFKWDETNRTTVFEAGMPVSGEAASTGRIFFKTRPATRVIAATHFGSYEKTEYLYFAMDEFILEHGLVNAGGPIEIYVVDPGMEPDTSKWQTNVYFPIR